MTSLRGKRRLIPALFIEQPEDRRTVDDILEPLKRGEPVVLSVQDPQLPKRTRLKHGPVLMLIPSERLGGSGKLVLALQGHGCEIVDVAAGLKPISFFRLGLGMSLALALTKALKRTLNGG